MHVNLYMPSFILQAYPYFRLVTDFSEITLVLNPNRIKVIFASAFILKKP